MSRILVVVLGAGSSFDCVETDRISATNFRSEYRPPLVNGLFSDNPVYVAILSHYGRLATIAEDIRIQLRYRTSIENLLKELKGRALSNPTFEKAYRQIPLYLQELLGEVSAHYNVDGNSSKFHTLLKKIEASPFGKVLFLTTNYDLFLEHAFSDFFRMKFDDIPSYVNIGDKYSIVKLHGSVNWGQQITNAKDFPGGNVTEYIDLIPGQLKLLKSIQILDGHGENSRVISSRLMYPSLSIPIGEEKEFVCAEEHVEVARNLVKNGTHFLFCGFSAFDPDVLTLLRESPKEKKVKIVSKSKDSAIEVLSRIDASDRGKWLSNNKNEVGLIVSKHKFSHFVNDSELDDFLC